MLTKKYKISKFWKILIFGKYIFFRNSTNRYFFVSILLRILRWFRIRHFFQVYFIILGDIGRESLAKSQKCHFFGKIRHGYGLFWPQSVDFGQGYSVPVRGRYVRVCAGWCLYVSVGAYGAGAKSRPVSFTQGRYQAGDTMHIS